MTDQEYAQLTKSVKTVGKMVRYNQSAKSLIRSDTVGKTSKISRQKKKFAETEVVGIGSTICPVGKISWCIHLDLVALSTEKKRCY